MRAAEHGGTQAGRAAGATNATHTTHAERGQRLAELILATALSSGLRAGSRLPTERELSIDLAVTRSSVRHALAILEVQGQISREVGRGTFLRDLPPPGPAGLPEPREAPEPAMTDYAPADVMTIRRLLEPPVMSLVVAWATAADLEEMDRCLAGGDRAATFEEFESWDLALHHAIMAASHSPLLVALYGIIEGVRHGHIWGDLKRRSTSVDRRAQYQADHRAVVDALRSRDSGRAVEAMRVHLSRVQEHLNITDPAGTVTWR
ncbi:MAG: FadR/GntR family transcriptional regulator [Streptosporangiaceae bacterium]